MNKNLHEKVRKDLEQKGELASLKAKFENKIKEAFAGAKAGKPNQDHRFIQELESKHGKICCALVKDFFEQFDMKMTTGIFMPEAQLESVDEDIEMISRALGRPSERRHPLIFEVIERVFAYDGEEDEIETSKNVSDSNMSQESPRDQYYESVGSGYDQSTNSLAMEEFDYVEFVKKPRN